MIAGLILAAGGGRRFGGTKQLADFRGRPLLQHAIEAMLAVPALDRVVVVLGHDAAEIGARVEFGSAEIVVCSDWERGQAASLRSGVAALPSAETVVITLGDQPFITPQVIAGALEQLGDHDAVRATYDGAPGHPVVLSRRVLDAAGELDGDMGARHLLARFRVNQWEAGHLCSATDVDTREALARLSPSGADVAAGDVPPEALAGGQVPPAPPAPTGAEVTTGDAAPEAVAGICGGDVPPLVGEILTGTGLTLAQAAAQLERGENVPALTPVQRRIVEDYATTR